MAGEIAIFGLEEFTELFITLQKLSKDKTVIDVRVDGTGPVLRCLTQSMINREYRFGTTENTTLLQAAVDDLKFSQAPNYLVMGLDNHSIDFRESGAILDDSYCRRYDVYDNKWVKQLQDVSVDYLVKRLGVCE